VALTGVYKWYFQTEVELLNPEDEINHIEGQYRYTLHQNNITITREDQPLHGRPADPSTSPPTAATPPATIIAQEPITSEAWQQLIRWDQDQKLGVGHALTMAMRQDTRTDRTWREIVWDTTDAIAETLRLATPPTDNPHINPLHGRPSRRPAA
jgi:hypothetical protein